MNRAELIELYTERAAILEYEAGHPRTIAERLAADMLGLPPPAPPRRERRYDGKPEPGVTRVSRWAGERAEPDDPREEIGSCTTPRKLPAPIARPQQPSPTAQPPGPSSCRSCGAAIVWATSVKDGIAGKLAPWQLDDRGEWTITRAVIVGRTGAQYAAQHAGPASMQLELGATAPSGPERYTSHFATCPDRDRWRSPR